MPRLVASSDPLADPCRETHGVCGGEYFHKRAVLGCSVAKGFKASQTK
jgi:hypothetical protein